jgi:uroporphyrinogen-III decarboxylase
MPSSGARRVSEAGSGAYAGFQAGAALMAEAMRGVPTRVPVFAQMHEFVAGYLKIPRREFFRRPEIMVPAMLEVEQRFGLDVASVTYDVYNIEAEALGQPLAWTEDGMPDIDRSSPLIRDRDDLSRIRTPDFDAVPCCQRVLRMHEEFRRLTGMEPSLSVCAPFTLATGLRGIEQFLLDIYTEPDFAREILDRITDEVLVPWTRYQQRAFPGATGVSAVDATASPPVVNLEILREWVTPPILRLRKACGPGVATANWAGERFLADPMPMLALKLLVGPGALWGQDPDVEALGPAYYRQYADRHNVPLILGVGAAFLATADPAAVADRVWRYVETGGRGGRFALYLCNLGATTPPENLAAAVEAAHASRVG